MKPQRLFKHMTQNVYQFSGCAQAKLVLQNMEMGLKRELTKPAHETNNGTYIS